MVCIVIVGGAVVPPFTGHLADHSGSLALVLALPATCYAIIAAFSYYARRAVAA